MSMTDGQPKPSPTPAEQRHAQLRIACRKIATRLMQRGALNYDAEPVEAMREAMAELTKELEER